MIENQEFQEKIKYLNEVQKKENSLWRSLEKEENKELFQVGQMCYLIFSYEQVRHLVSLLVGSQWAIENLKTELTEQDKIMNKVLLDRFENKLLQMDRLQLTPEKLEELEQNFKDAKASIKMLREKIWRITKERGDKLTCKFCGEDITFNYDFEKYEAHLNNCKLKKEGGEKE